MPNNTNTILVSSDEYGFPSTRGIDTHFMPAISGNGQIVIFNSSSSNLMYGDTNSSVDTFVKKIYSGEVMYAVSDSKGARPSTQILNIKAPALSAPIFENQKTTDYQTADAFSISEYGFIAFATKSNTLVDIGVSGFNQSNQPGSYIYSGDNNDYYDIYVKDIITGAIKLASSNAYGLAGAVNYYTGPQDFYFDKTGFNSNVPDFSISAGGSLVAFVSSADNLVPDDRNFQPDIFIKNIQNGSISRVNTTSSGQVIGSHFLAEPVFSENDKFIAFVGTNDLMPFQGNESYYNDWQNIFRKNLETNEIKRVGSVGQGTGILANGTLHEPVISEDGRFVAFTSNATNLAGGDYNNTVDVFRKDMNDGGQTLLVSVTIDGVQSPNSSKNISMSADGRYIVFESIGADFDPLVHTYSYIKDMNTGVLQALKGPANAISSAKITSDGNYILINDPIGQLYRINNPLVTHQSLVGTDNNDTLLVSAGYDIVDGGLGIDVAVFSGNRADYTLTKKSSYWTISNGTGPTVVIQNVERLKFADHSVALDISQNPGQVYRLYQAAFNRAPDQPGLGYWIDQMDHGLSLHNVAASFIKSSEFKSIFGQNPAASQLVTSLYQNVLHRPPEKEGYDYWMNQLNSYLQTQEQVLSGFSESAENQANVVGLINNGIDYIF